MEAAMDRALTLGGYGRGDGYIEESARKTYARMWGKFDSWCRSHGRRPMPASSEALAAFCHWLVQDAGYAPATAEVACTAVRWRHRVAGETPPDRVAAWYILRTADATPDDPVGEVRPFRAACRDDLATVAEVCDLATAAGVRDLLAVVLPYALGFGDGELAVLRFEHLDFEPAAAVRVTLPDHVRHHHVTGWGHQTVGCQLGVEPWHPEQLTPAAGAGYGCPACTLRLWHSHVAQRGAGASVGPLLRPVDPYGRIAGAPLHTGSVRADSSFRPVSVRKLIRQVMRRADLDEAVYRRAVASLRLGSALEAQARQGSGLEVALRAGYAPGSLRLARHLALPGINPGIVLN